MANDQKTSLMWTSDGHRKSLDSLSMSSEDLKRLQLRHDLDTSDMADIFPPRRKQKGCRIRKRTNTLLHTHIALITICILSSLDAVCVIGQVICDILIMSDQLAEYDELHTRAETAMVPLLPQYLNTSDHWTFKYPTARDIHMFKTYFMIPDQLAEYDDLHTRAETVMVPLLPQYLNTSDHWTFKDIVYRLEEVCTADPHCVPHSEGHSHMTSSDHSLIPHMDDGHRILERSVY